MSENPLTTARDRARRLYDLLTEIETANGPLEKDATKLENLVRYAWDEAREDIARIEARTRKAIAG